MVQWPGIFSFDSKSPSISTSWYLYQVAPSHSRHIVPISKTRVLISETFQFSLTVALALGGGLEVSHAGQIGRVLESTLVRALRKWLRHRAASEVRLVLDQVDRGVDVVVVALVAALSTVKK